MFDFITSRIKERTSMDGIILIGAGVVFLVFKPFASIAAYAAIAYGAWTFYKKED
ncbi:hypothetical protein OAA34_00665 [bacterium]|jgi:hypothetical protein|nr:hypothetical protein [bacterium]